MAEQVDKQSKLQKNLNTEVGMGQRKENSSLLSQIISVFLKVLIVLTFSFVMILTYILGLLHGYNFASQNTEKSISQFLSDYSKRIANLNIITPTVTATPTPTKPQTSAKKKVGWGGPDLWDAVNKRRVELGVNPLSTRSELCTIASIRLNELLELGDLDGHEGFSNMKIRRPDLKWIFDKYGTVAEFLARGGDTATATVGLWENTLGHSQLLKGGEYVWGCIYAQDSYAVAITAF